MANEKKYSEREAAFAVLAKAQEILSKSELIKSEKLRKDGAPAPTNTSAASQITAGFNGATGTSGIQQGLSNLGSALGFGKAESYCDAHAKEIKGNDSHKIVAKSECVKCMGKAEETENKEKPSNPMKPQIPEKEASKENQDFEAKPKDAKIVDHGSNTQPAPGANPKEQAEGNNPPSGAIPGNGIHKLMYFTGHIHAKRKHKKPTVA